MAPKTPRGAGKAAAPKKGAAAKNQPKEDSSDNAESPKVVNKKAAANKGAPPKAVDGDNADLKKEGMVVRRTASTVTAAAAAVAPKDLDGKPKGGGKRSVSNASGAPLSSRTVSVAASQASIQYENSNLHVFDDCKPQLRQKLDIYRTAYLKCLDRLFEDEITASVALPIMFVPLKELLELMNADNDGGKLIERFMEYAFNDFMLCVCFIAKAKSASASGLKVEPLIEFLYTHSMHIEYMVEHLAEIKTMRQFPEKGVTPAKPKMVLNVWDKLLGLVLAKDRKLRVVFCTITYLVTKRACNDEIEIPGKLFERHVDTFLFIIADPNKEIRYRCLQLLENFQTENVRRALLEHLSDPAAAVRMAATSFVEIPPEVEEAVPVLRYVIARVADVSKEVRQAVYKKLGEAYSSIPVEMCYLIMAYGLAEESQHLKGAFVKMLKSWIETCGSLLEFISEMLSQAEDVKILEDTLSLYMKSTDLLNTISLDVTEGQEAKPEEKKEDEMEVEDTSSIKWYMKRFLTLTPAEMMLVNIFYQNHASPEEIKLINIMDIISYSYFLLTNFCHMPKEVSQLPQVPNPDADEDDDFIDAVEADESVAVYKYTDEETAKMNEQYCSIRLVCHTFRALLIIAHCHGLDDSYQQALAELMCDKILLYGPVRSNINGLMTDVVSQTSLGNNSYFHSLPSRWLKSGFVFAATSLLRYIYARRFKFEGKFMGDDPQMEKRHFEVSMTRKILSIISDIKDPFQTSGVSNISIRREELESMVMEKIMEFDPSSYSIEHLIIFDAKLREQMEQTCTQQAELESVKSSTDSGEVEKGVLRKQEEALASLLEKQMAFANIIRQHLKDRWTRIMAIVEALLGQTKSLCSEDAGLAEFPRAILLPQMTFYCSTVVQWQDQNVTDQFCDVLTSKCLGTWCMLNNGKMELWRQLNAFHVALKGALAILEGCINQVDSSDEPMTDNVRRRIEMQTLRCEMYMTTLTDLLVTSVDLQQDAATEDPNNVKLMEDLKDTIWGIVNCSVRSTKYVQSIAIRQGCKLLLTELLHSKDVDPDAVNTADDQKNDEIAVLRLRGLLELAFISPVSERYVASDFKFVKSSRNVSITPEDKNAILSTCALYPTLSYRHLRNFHKVLEQILMRSIHHALQLDVQMAGFSHLISFMIQTILHKSPLYFSMESFAKYFKWLLLITIDKGSVLADKAGFVSLIGALISMYVRRNVYLLVRKFGLPKSITIQDDEAVSMSDLCAMTNPSLALMDLRDMKVLLNHLMTNAGVVRVKTNVKVITDLIDLLNQHMNKIARLYTEKLAGSDGPFTVEAGDPPKINFQADESRSFGDLVDAYDAYISSLGSRTLYVLMVPEEQSASQPESPAVPTRQMTRTGRGAKNYKYASDDSESSQSDDDFDEESD